MKFRTAMLATVLVLVAAILAATTLSVASVLEDAARRDLAGDLGRARVVLGEQLAQRSAAMRSEARVVAEEPRLKAVTAAEEVSRDTIVGVAFELKKAVGSDLFLLTDAGGRLLVDVADPDQSGFDLGKKQPVADALARGDAGAVWTEEQRALQVEAHRLAFGEQVVGVLAVGRSIDDAVLETIRRQTAADAVLLLDGRAIARSRLEVAPIDAATLGVTLAPLAGRPAPSEIALGGARFLAHAAPVPGYAGERRLEAVLLRSLDAALAPARRLTRILYGISGTALLAAVVLAAALSSRLARPLDALVGFTRRIAAGDLGTRAVPAGPTEVRALAEAMNRMVGELEHSRAELAQKQRLERELEIAQRIQTSILPRRLGVPGLEIAACMQPASEVGGDYYDVIPVGSGAWIGIGDVAGHGLPAGLVMLMIQSGVAGLVRAQPDAAPSRILHLLNGVIFDNVRHRLVGDEHVTLSLLRYEGDGRFRFAGAHEEMVVWRAASGRCERIATPGTWVGAIADIGGATIDSELSLEPGDVLLLYTDGVTEAMSEASEQFGIERVTEVVAAAAGKSATAVVESVLERAVAWQAQQDDDMTVVAIRRVG